MTTQNDRVQRSTPNSINDEIEEQLRENIRYYSRADDASLSRRISELEKEWNMDRTLITNASILAGVGLLLGIKLHKQWLILPGVVLSFLLQHGLQGWCPPLPLFRKFGIRSFKEIDRERFALKYLRGDYGSVREDVSVNPDKLFDAVSK
jgi:hypothetical protein